MDPVTLSLIGTGLGGLTGFLGGKSRAAEARRVENMNRQMSAADTMYAPLVGTKAYQQAVPDAGPGAMGGAFGGALSGFNQAQAFSGSNIYKDMLRKKAGSADGSRELASLMG
jgi:hypothetical protein